MKLVVLKDDRGMLLVDDAIVIEDMLKGIKDGNLACFIDNHATVFNSDLVDHVTDL